MNATSLYRSKNSKVKKVYLLTYILQRKSVIVKQPIIYYHTSIRIV